MPEDTPQVPVSINIRFIWLLIKELIGGVFRKPKKVDQAKPEIKSDELRVWYIGHATMLVNFYGTTILTDPVFKGWIPPRRLVQPGIRPQDLPTIDFLVMSHAHLDHWQKGDIKKIADKIRHMIIPRNCMDRVPQVLKDRVTVLDWREQQQIGDMKLYAYKPRHWGEMYPWEHKNRGYNMYVFERDGRQVFWAGDTAMTDSFAEVASQFKNIELALLPIGAYEPRVVLKNIHMSPDDALQAFEILDAQHMVPYHFDTFPLSWEPVGEASQLLEQGAQERGVLEYVHILEAGASWEG